MADCAEHAVAFKREMLQHVKGPLTGQPLILEPWQDDLTRTIHGWRRPDRTRRFRHVYCEVPRKNGKSTWLASEICYSLFCDPQSAEGGELYSAGVTAEQAGLVFGMVTEMIRRNPFLTDRAKTSPSVRRINRIFHGVVSNTFYRALPSEASQTHGFSPTFIGADELHEWPGRDFYDALQTGTGARTQPLSIDITTAGYDRESICWIQHEYAERVRDGEIDDDAFLPMLFTVPPDADWTSPKTWAAANPNLGISLSRDYLQRECRRAQECKTYENSFRRLHLNQWTQQATRFLQMAHWHAAAANYGETDLAHAPCYGGLDLSATEDLTAFLLVFRADGAYRTLPYLWIPEGSADRIERSDRVPYRQWARQGHLTITPGDRINYDYITAAIRELGRQFDIRQIGYDPWQADSTRLKLEEYGFACIKCPQNMRTLSAPLKELERALVAQELCHPGNPCLDWQAQNLEVINDTNGNIKPVKPKHGAHRLRIDGMVALTMALALALADATPHECTPDMFQYITL